LLTSIHLAEQCTGDGDGEPPPRATPKSDAKAHSASRSADIDAPRANRARIAAKARLFLKRQLSTVRARRASRRRTGAATTARGGAERDVNDVHDVRYASSASARAATSAGGASWFAAMD
jgi:hypothetical protein